MSNELKKTVQNAGDAIKEGVHRGQADAEHETRTEFGDVMTPEEKGQSVVNEVVNDAKAAGDRLKRDVRNAT